MECFATGWKFSSKNLVETIQSVISESLKYLKSKSAESNGSFAALAKYLYSFETNKASDILMDYQCTSKRCSNSA